MSELQFIHRATDKDKGAFLLAKLSKEYPNGNFETRGLNIFGQEPDTSRDFLSGFCYAFDRPKK